MSHELDVNKVVAQVFVDLTKATLAGLKGKVAGALTVLLDALRKDFEPYLVSTLKRCSVVRTFLHRDEPVPLFSIYVRTYFKQSNKNTIEDVDFVEKLPDIQHALIIGTASSGKSIFLKFLFLSLLKDGEETFRYLSNFGK